MDVATTLKRLEALTDPRGQAIWKKVHGESYPGYGIGLTKLKQLSKEVKKNHDLSISLWETGIHDARILAVMIEEPKKVEQEQIEVQMGQVSTWDLADKYVEYIIAKTSNGQQYFTTWRNHEHEMKQRSAFILLVHLIKKGKLEQGWIDVEQVLIQIKNELQQSRNWVKEGMAYALMAIGSINKELNIESISVAQELGEIEVDYGATSCQSPNVLLSLRSEITQNKIEKV